MLLASYIANVMASENWCMVVTICLRRDQKHIIVTHYNIIPILNMYDYWFSAIAYDSICYFF